MGGGAPQARVVIQFATGAGLRTVHWKQQEPREWPEFIAWLELDSPADQKDCGGYVAGLLTETEGHLGKPKCVGLHRKRGAVVSRSVLTLDADHAVTSFVADFALVMGCAAVLHTTWRHTDESPRWRALLPLSRDVSPAEYRLLVEVIMAELGPEQFDRGSREPERFMHRPSTQGHYRAHVLAGGVLDVEKWLAQAVEAGMALLERSWERYEDSSPQRDPELGPHPRCVEEVELLLDRLRGLPQPWYTGAGWDLGVFKVACELVELANSGWTGYSLEQAKADLLEHAPVDEGWGDKDNQEKFDSALVKVAGGGKHPPDDTTPEQDFGSAVWPEVPRAFDDSYLCAWMSHKGLGGNWRWTPGMAWSCWDGRVWERDAEEEACEAVRRVVLRLNRSLVGGDPAVSKAMNSLLSVSRNRGVVTMMRGVQIVKVLDAQYDWLNVGNGMVDLRTGEVVPHNRDFYFTKLTGVPYVPGAKHKDWDKALECLDPEVVDWMQVRFGQAATGWPTSDDVLPICQGSGSNGKSTLVGALFRALGDFMVPVPEKLLRASPNDHPTELMSLRGARVAVIEETPEVAQLNVQRLKSVLGTPKMTARSVFKDNVTWSPTHSLFVMSNYTPEVRETDHGTWRRLALVKFERTFPRDEEFRSRLERGDDGVAEAVLAWVVEGARRWYEAGRIMPQAPAKVLQDTAEWRGETDYAARFIQEHLVLDPQSCVLASELLEEFNAWMRGQGYKPWSAGTLVSRMKNNSEVIRNRVYQEQSRDLERLSLRDSLTPVSGRSWVWRGLRWLVGG